MRFNKRYRCLPIGSLISAFVLIASFSGCQSGSSEGEPVVITPVDPNDKASLSLVSPVGGRAYTLGDSLHVTATVEGNGQGTINAIDVLLSPDGGRTWGALSDRPVPVAAHSDFDFSWKIPASFTADGKTFSLAENGDCLVRIAQHNTGDSLKASVSGKFKIEDTVFIRLTNPLGGESFEVGDTLPITWTAKEDPNDPILAVDVLLSPDSGKTWGFLRSGSIAPGSPIWGRFPWVVMDSIRILGGKTNLVGNPGVCLRVEEYSTQDPKKRFQSGMISISTTR
jgi:hypothetical protein